MKIRMLKEEAPSNSANLYSCKQRMPAVFLLTNFNFPIHSIKTPQIPMCTCINTHVKLYIAFHLLTRYFLIISQ